MLKLRDLLTEAQSKGLDRLDAQMLLLHALGRDVRDRAWLIAHDTDAVEAWLNAAQIQSWRASIVQRASGVPMAYLTGHREFFGLVLQVDARVLDPRPDTETLVEWALALNGEAPIRVLDCGTGSGAIALALAHTRSAWQVHALDVSADALAVARSNAQRLGLTLSFHEGSWFAALAADEPKFDLIVSNPPYIAEGDAHLANLKHEPRLALTSGADGLDAIRHLVAHAPAHLKTNGWLLLEHGHEQAAAVRNAFTAHGWTDVQSRLDLAGIERCTGARWPG